MIDGEGIAAILCDQHNSGMTQMSIDGDTGIVRGADNMPLGTVQDDAFCNTAMIDNSGMTVARADNAGFISDGDGQVVAHTDHNVVDTVQSTIRRTSR